MSARMTELLTARGPPVAHVRAFCGGAFTRVVVSTEGAPTKPPPRPASAARTAAAPTPLIATTPGRGAPSR